jgi:hypothetical protein
MSLNSLTCYIPGQSFRTSHRECMIGSQGRGTGATRVFCCDEPAMKRPSLRPGTLASNSDAKSTRINSRMAQQNELTPTFPGAAMRPFISQSCSRARGHGPQVTVVQQRTRCGSMKADPAERARGNPGWRIGVVGPSRASSSWRKRVLTEIGFGPGARGKRGN